MNFTLAIGDIHGRFDLLVKALEWIDAFEPAAKRHVIFLGDYVDRGPRSRQVIDRLMKLPNAKYTKLLGNHEEMFQLSYYDRKSSETKWWITKLGGHETLESYDAMGANKPFWEIIPRAHIDWIAARPRLVSDGHRFYCHAGFRPGYRAEEQRDEDLIWIRGDFLTAAGAHMFPDGKHIVHGHTPRGAPELLPWRTNLDTGAYKSGVLSIGVFDADAPGGPLFVHPIIGPPA